MPDAVDALERLRPVRGAERIADVVVDARVVDEQLGHARERAHGEAARDGVLGAEDLLHRLHQPLHVDDAPELRPRRR